MSRIISFDLLRRSPKADYKFFLNIISDFEDRIAKVNNDPKFHQKVHDLTVFERGMTCWNITPFAHQYEITGRKLFVSLVNGADPFNMGFLSYRPMNELDYEQAFDRAAEGMDRVFVDYCNGICVKNGFPTKLDGRFVVDLHAYQAGLEDDGLERVTRLLSTHYKMKELPLA